MDPAALIVRQVCQAQQRAFHPAPISLHSFTLVDCRSLPVYVRADILLVSNKHLKQAPQVTLLLTAVHRKFYVCTASATCS